MIAGDGFRWGNFYGSYSASEDFDGIGFELGMMDILYLRGLSHRNGARKNENKRDHNR